MDRVDGLILILLAAAMVTPIVCDFKLLLLHTNDLHSRYVEVSPDTSRCQDPRSGKCYGGFARIRKAVTNMKKEARKKGFSTLYLDAGDVFQETIYFMEFKWDLAATMMNLLAPDAMSLGNHELDNGVPGLVQYLQQLKPPMLCCNINIDDEPTLRIENQLLPSKVIDYGGTKVGIIGYLTTDITSKHLGKVKVLDEIESVRKESERLKKSGVNIIIALGHAGYEKDKEIARKVKEVDVVVGAHSHTYLHSGDDPVESKVHGEYPTIVTKEGSTKTVPVVQAFFGSKYIGRLELTFDDEGNLIPSLESRLITLDNKIKQDKEVTNILKPYSKIIHDKYSHIVGKTEVLFHGCRLYCRVHECNIGNLVADAYVDYANKQIPGENSQKKVRIALVDSKSIKEDLYPKGEGKNGIILMEDVMVVLPYGFHLVVLELSGGAIRQALECGVKQYSPETDGLLRAHLLQVAGLKLHFDMRKPPGERLTSAKVVKSTGDGYEDLDDKAQYLVVMSDYLANNKDKFPSLVGQNRAYEFADVTEYDVLANYIKDHTPLSDKTSPIDGRMVITEVKTQ